MLDITQIPAPRIPLIDERTGLLSRQWYRFFYNLYVLTGGGTNAITLEELQLGPPNQPDFTEILKEVNNNISPEYQDQSGNFLATLDAAQLMAMMARFENLEAAIQGAYLQPPPAIGTVTDVTGTAPVVSSGGTAPAISMPVATALVDGYLSSTDWATFNAKQPAGSYLVSGGALGTPSSGTVTNLTGTASININGTVGATTANTGAFTTLSTTDNITPLTAAKGVNFTANTALAGMTSQLLNWYEEGTYTPTLVGGTTAGTTTYTTQVGFYTRIGNRVTFDLTIIYTAATGTGEARLLLPSTANSASGYIAVVNVRTTIPSSAGYSLVGGINAGAAYARYVTYDGLTGALTTQSITSGSYTIRLSGTYFV
jgi:hypothetical protein